jgi:hypothetical protein
MDGTFEIQSSVIFILFFLPTTANGSVFFLEMGAAVADRVTGILEVLLLENMS